MKRFNKYEEVLRIMKRYVKIKKDGKYEKKINYIQTRGKNTYNVGKIQIYVQN